MNDTLLLDLRYALRALRRSPRFTALAVLTLGLGIGTATVAFGTMYQVLLDPLPGVRDPGRLGLALVGWRTENGWAIQDLNASQRATVLRMSPAIEGISGFQNGQDAVGATDVSVRQLSVAFVSGDYFALLGARPAMGRLLSDADDPPNGGTRVAVISDQLWKDVFGGRPDVLGQRLTVNGLSFTVVGVSARGFKGTSRFQAPFVWLPGNTACDVHHNSFCAQRSTTYRYFEHVLRLRSGASFEQAAAQMRAAVHVVAVGDTANFRAKADAEVFPGLGLEPLPRAAIHRRIDLILGIAGLVLLITCANVANLALLRRLQRRADVSVRLVLGAGRWRVARLFLLESAIIGLASGVTGTAVAFVLRELFGALRLLGVWNAGPVNVDGRLFAFAAGVGLVSSLLAGAVPALLGFGGELGAEVRASSRTQVGGAPRLRASLAVLQVAVSLTLVTGGYLLASTLKHVADLPLGFDPTGVTLFQVSPSLLGYSDAQARIYFVELEQRLQGLGGVSGAALMDRGPMRGPEWVRFARGDGLNGEWLQGANRQVSADYFATMGVPVLRGRSFSPADEWRDSTARPYRTIISVSLARRLFGSADPLGRLIKKQGPPDTQLEVIGVVGDVRPANPAETSRAEVYEPLGQSYDPGLEVEVGVKSALPPAMLDREVERVARSLDPSLPVEYEGTLVDRVAETVASQTILLKLVGALSILCLLLTAVGVYATVAYGVSTRIREFGVRVALGADKRSLIRTALGPAPVIVGTGVVLGTLGALYLTKFIAASLYGVSRFDPLAFVIAALVLAVAVLLASWLPARRAAEIDPMVALRYE